MGSLQAFPADGYTARWDSWDREHHEELTLRWENEAWTASGVVSKERIQYVVRLSAMWEVRQFLLFRDAEDPDLWLGTDGNGRWGEMNGAHRPELDGCTTLAIGCTPFDHVVPIRQQHASIDTGVITQTININVETLGLEVGFRHYQRADGSRLSVEQRGITQQFSIDQYGLPLNIDGQFRRR